MATMFADLFWILFRPRQTMRRILDSGRGGRWVIPIVLLAFLSRSSSTTDVTKATAALSDQSIVLLFVVGVVASLLVTLLLFYGIAWLATVVGRLLDGTGSARDVRMALGWSCAPLLWSLLFRIPAPILLRRMGVQETNDPAMLFEMISRGGCAIALVFLLLDVLFLIWYLVVASFTLAEAHKFSSGKGFAVLAISFLSPLIVVAAAVLTLAT